MNKQPFYFEMSVLFTATRELTEEEIEALVSKLKHRDIVSGSVSLGSYQVDAGDPADLL